MGTRVSQGCVPDTVQQHACGTEACVRGGEGRGYYYGNGRKAKARVNHAKQLTLPSGDQFLQLVDVVQHAGAWCSRDCSDFVRGLAFTGCRKGEAGQITLRDVDFDPGEVVVRGDPETATKNWTVRRVLLIPDARALFERMRSERPHEPLEAKVFRVGECQKALDRACKKVGADRNASRITTCGTCLQRGASKAASTFQPSPVGSDTKTVARWQ